MSTQTAKETRKGFRQASATRKPTLACIGYVAAVGEGKESKSKKYNVNPIEINGLAAGPNTTVYLLTRPEWFELDAEGNPSFRPDRLEEVEGGSGILFVYQKNIAQKGNVSLLQGVAGNEDRFGDLAETLLTKSVIINGKEETAAGDESAAVIEKLLEDFLVAGDGESPFEIGYVLRQQSTKTDDVDADGKAIYVLENRYEVSEWFEATEANKKKFRKRAEKSAEKAKAAGEPVHFKVTFDEGPAF